MKNKVDFLKIQDGKLGAINFNNMIPVKKHNYKIIDVNKKVKDENELKYQELLKDQLNWLNENYIQIQNKSFKLYCLYKDGKLSDSLKERCCNFLLLEEICDEYNSFK